MNVFACRWMVVNCPVSCNSCHLRDPKIRCRREALNMDTEPIYRPGTLLVVIYLCVQSNGKIVGDMEAMFRRIQNKELPSHLQYNFTVHSTSPWVVTFEDFLTDKEVNALIKTVKKWERSTDVGSSNEIGETGRILSTGRTSSNSWCDSECEAVRTLYK